LDTWFEPFAGSAAMAIWAARNRQPRRIVLGESCEAMAELWRAIICRPGPSSARYDAIWHGQIFGDSDYFNEIRARFNRTGDPIDLLYLLCRCVKNAVRFNRQGAFTQSVDRRRLGMRPARMAIAIAEAAMLLHGRTEIRSGDWLATVADANSADFIYLDPPYLGISEGRDRRYAEAMRAQRLIDGLSALCARRLRFALSYDGSTGGRFYGDALPAALGLMRVDLAAGRSAQATLAGRDEQTVESLYLRDLPPRFTGPVSTVSIRPSIRSGETP